MLVLQNEWPSKSEAEWRNSVKLKNPKLNNSYSSFAAADQQLGAFNSAPTSDV